MLHLAGNANPEIVLERTTSGTEFKGSIRITDAETMSFAIKDGGAASVNAMQIDSSGRLLVGTTSDASAGSVNSLVQVVTPDAGHLILGRNDSSISAGDAIGFLRFFGNDGGSYQECAAIVARADGTHANNDKPARLEFKTTADGASSATERMRIDSSGNVGIGTTSPSQLLEINGNSNPCLLIKDTTNNVTSIVFADDNNTYFGAASNHPVVFRVNNQEKVRIDSSGRLLLGTSTSLAVGSSAASDLQIVGTLGYQSLSRYSANGAGPNLILGKSRNASPGSHTIVQNNDDLGNITFAGDDGTDLQTVAARIVCEVDGTPGANDMPGRLVFSTTADGAASPTERMRITSGGRMYLYGNPNLFISNTAGAGTSQVMIAGGHSASSITSSTLSFRVYNNGNVQNTNNSYGAISDAKLKENIVNASSQWDDLKAIQVRNYNFIEGQTHTQIGVVAQEVETVSPGLVTESPDLDDEGNDLGTTTKSVNYSVLYMKAVKALQEAMERIETLETKVNALEGA